MLFTSSFAMAMYRHNVLDAASIAAIVAQIWKVAGPKFPTICLSSTFLLVTVKTCVRGMQQQVVAKKSAHGDSAQQRPW